VLIICSANKLDTASSKSPRGYTQAAKKIGTDHYYSFRQSTWILNTSIFTAEICSRENITTHEKAEDLVKRLWEALPLF